MPSKVAREFLREAAHKEEVSTFIYRSTTVIILFLD